MNMQQNKNTVDIANDKSHRQWHKEDNDKKAESNHPQPH